MLYPCDITNFARKYFRNHMEQAHRLILIEFWHDEQSKLQSKWPMIIDTLPIFGIEPIVIRPSFESKKIMKEGNTIFIPFNVAQYQQHLKVKQTTLKTPTEGSFTEIATVIRDFKGYASEKYFRKNLIKRWSVKAFKVCKELLGHNAIEYIITSGGTNHIHLLGKRLQEKHHIVWGLDFTSELLFKHTNQQNYFLSKQQLLLENELLLKADIVFTPLPSVCDFLSKKTMKDKKKFNVLLAPIKENQQLQKQSPPLRIYLNGDVHLENEFDRLNTIIDQLRKKFTTTETHLFFDGELSDYYRNALKNTLTILPENDVMSTPFDIVICISGRNLERSIRQLTRLNSYLGNNSLVLLIGSFSQSDIDFFNNLDEIHVISAENNQLISKEIELRLNQTSRKSNKQPHNFFSSHAISSKLAQQLKQTNARKTATINTDLYSVFLSYPAENTKEP